MKRGKGPYGRNGLVVRIVYFGLAVICGFWIALTQKARGKWIVLCYHGVQPEQAKRFDAQLRHVADRVVAVDQIGRGKPGVCLTFDDAFACLLDNVIPVSAELGAPITIFPVTENFDSIPKWDMPEAHPEKGLRTMSKLEVLGLKDNSLVTIGSHTATHPRLADVPEATVDYELQASHDALKGLLNSAPVDFALPHGSFNRYVCQTARIVGYQRVYTLDPRMNEHLSDDGLVGRFSVDPDMWIAEFRMTAAGAYSYLFTLRRVLKRIQSWVRLNPKPLSRNALIEKTAANHP